MRYNWLDNIYDFTHYSEKKSIRGFLHLSDCSFATKETLIGKKNKTSKYTRLSYLTAFVHKRFCFSEIRYRRFVNQYQEGKMLLRQG